MHCIRTGSSDPYFNLALEEILLKSGTEEFIIVASNDSSVIIGKHQSAHRETDTRFVAENNIPVLRRISGGGTVYHDEGNVNFTFIRNCDEGRQVDFPKYSKPVIDFLASLGLKPELRGSDITVAGKKISGNAEHVHRKRVLHHGTLLFNADLDKLRLSIRKDYSAYTTRAVASNPSPVNNLSNILTQFQTTESFRAALTAYLSDAFSAQLTDPGQERIEEAEKLAVLKFRSWEWNYAYGPEYAFCREISLNSHKRMCRLSVQDGIIKDIHIEGMSDFVSAPLKGCRHMPDEMLKALRSAGIGDIDIFDFF